MISSRVLITGDYLDGKVLINGAIILPLFVSILQDAILFIMIWSRQEVCQRSYAKRLLYWVT